MNTEEIINQALMPRFNMGAVYLSAGFIEAYASAEIREARANELLGRHSIGDWGDVCPEDAGKNNIAAANKGQILSSYSIVRAQDQTITVLVMTDHDHEVTTILLPSDN